MVRRKKNKSKYVSTILPSQKIILINSFNFFYETLNFSTYFGGLGIGLYVGIQFM